MNPLCGKCGGPVGSGSNHEEDHCQDVQISRLEAEIERLTREHYMIQSARALEFIERDRLREALTVIAQRQHQFPAIVAQAALDGRGAWREALRGADSTLVSTTRNADETSAVTGCKYSDNGCHECKHCDEVWPADERVEVQKGADPFDVPADKTTGGHSHTGDDAAGGYNHTSPVDARCPSLNPDMGMGRCEKPAGHGGFHQAAYIQWFEVR